MPSCRCIKSSREILCRAYEHIQGMPTRRPPLSRRVQRHRGYVLAFVSNNAYNNSKTVRCIGPGVRLQRHSPARLTAAYYGLSSERLRHRQRQAGLHDGGIQHCAARQLQAFSFDADLQISTCTSTLTWGHVQRGARRRGQCTSVRRTSTPRLAYATGSGATRKRADGFVFESLSFGAA